MTPIETTNLITSAIVVAIGIPIAVFHRAIVKELRHLRAHFLAHHKAPKAARRASHRKA